MSHPRRSAALILHRKGPADIEVFLAARSPQLRFLGGHLAFPGGAVEKGDGDLPLRGGGDLDAGARELIGCAARELFEETGVLLAAGAARALATDGAKPFADILRDNGLEIDAPRFRPTLRLITPAFSATRFDTQFYLVEMTEADPSPRIVPGELVSGGWTRPGDCLREWRLGKERVAPPVLDILECFESDSIEQGVARLREIPAEFEGSGRAIRTEPGYELVPLETPPLPPEIPANAFLVGGKRFVLVDPTPKRERQQEHLLSVLDRRLALGDRLDAIVLTHHHPDHVGALDLVVSKYGAPVWAHPITGELLSRKLDRELPDGAEIDLGESLDGRAGWSLRALFTPGHAEGHIVLHDERRKSLVAGDLVSTLVSMYVGSPGGNLRQYFASLERVRALEIETLYPSHGSATRDPRKLIDDTLRHRRARIEEVHAVLRSGVRTPEELAFEVYPEAAGKLRPLIVRTSRAALEYLVEDGRAEKCGDDSFRKV